jgi:hypothetical protein
MLEKESKNEKLIKVLKKENDKKNMVKTVAELEKLIA